MLLEAQARGFLGRIDLRAILEVSAWSAAGVGWLATLSLLLARNALLPAAGGNRATLLRLHGALFLGLLLLAGVLTIPQAIATATGPAPGPWPWRTWRLAGGLLIGALDFALLCLAVAGSTEDPPDRRTAASAARWRGPLLPARLLYPGAWRGAAFALLLTAATLGFAGAWLEHLGPAVPAEEVGRPVDPCGRLALGGGAHVASVLAAGLLFRSLSASAARARALLTATVLGAQVLSLIGLLASAPGDSGLVFTPWNGAAFSLITLGISAFSATRTANGDLDPTEWVHMPALDLDVGGRVIPFATVFAALHLALAAAFVAGAGVVAWRRRAGTPRLGPPGLAQGTAGTGTGA